MAPIMPYFPVSTRRRLDVYATCYNVETTSCACWIDSILNFILELKFNKQHTWGCSVQRNILIL